MIVFLYFLWSVLKDSAYSLMGSESKPIKEIEKENNEGYLELKKAFDDAM